MPAMETRPLPPGWDVADPSTWRLVSEVAVALPGPGHALDDPIVGKRELVTGAHEFGHAEDPSLLLGMLPRRAAAWWADVLEPIHRARVAAVRYPIESEGLLAGSPPSWEAGPDDPLDVRNPLLPGTLEARAAAAAVFLETLRFPGEDRRPAGAGGRG
jgi:hypothetical protein